MMANTKARRRLRDGGASDLVVIILSLFLIIGIAVTIVDSFMYFNNRSNIYGFAHDSARSVAIMGGDGTAAQGTTIENTYGVSRASVCAGIGTAATTQELASKVGNMSNIECALSDKLARANNLVNVRVKGVKCTPSLAQNIGQRTVCEVTWAYGGLPLSGFGFITLGKDTVTVGTGETEVQFTQDDTGLQDRP